jgi:hypothetical protein
MADNYNADTRCKGKQGHKMCKSCGRKRAGTDLNIFANPPAAGNEKCRYYLDIRR